MILEFELMSFFSFIDFEQARKERQGSSLRER